MAAQKKHADHDYIKERQHRYSEAWKSGSVDKLIDFYNKDDFIYSHLGQSALLSFFLSSWPNPRPVLHNLAFHPLLFF